MNRLKKFIEHKAYNIRVNVLSMTTAAQSGHPTSALSAADLVATLFFDTMHFDLLHPENPNNDRFILSKGHASPLLYAVYKELGVLTQKDLSGYRSFDSILEGHPTTRFSYTEAATGSLGIGLSIGAGMALSAKMDKRDFKTYVLMGDGELAEGSIWEAAEIAHYYKLDNLIGIVDCNRLGQSSESLHGHHVKRYAEKFEAFGWKSIIIDGHNVQQIMAALRKSRDPNSHPTVIIAKTIKGYGVHEVEDKIGFHGKPFSQEQLSVVLPEMEERFIAAAKFQDKDYQWHPIKPKDVVPSYKKTIKSEKDAVKFSYKIGELIATRKAFGEALVVLGEQYENIVSLDAEVKNSTYAELFEKKFPERFVQCFIAEQNMVGMAVGFDKRSYIPFVSTFAAFFSRAYDQIRMAAIGRSLLKLVGSHAGISIGKDGPSQMGLEDIALMSALPNSIVLYPCDAISTHRLLFCMALYYDGIAYLRTTRTETPVIYHQQEDFFIGGCKVLKSSVRDKVCIVAAGITVHEALKAYALLEKEGIAISVIDLYSIKPLDAETIKSIALQSASKVITVEDHYLQGGLGQAVVYALRNEQIAIECLAVQHLPRSGEPEKLMAFAAIDAAAIVKKVHEIIKRDL